MEELLSSVEQVTELHGNSFVLPLIRTNLVTLVVVESESPVLHRFARLSVQQRDFLEQRERRIGVVRFKKVSYLILGYCFRKSNPSHVF